jgi:hypothetical protein
MATLVISRADGTTHNFQLDGEAMTIGRHPDSTVVLEASSASGQHALLRLREDGHHYLQDLGSSNGTRVNGVEIEETRLNDADQISFGDEAAAFFLVDVETVPVAQFAPEPTHVRVVPPMAMPRAAPPKVRSHRRQQDEGAGCTSIFLVSCMFLLAFFLGLALKHYNTTGRFILGDLVERAMSGRGTINIQMQDQKGTP